MKSYKWKITAFVVWVVITLVEIIGNINDDQKGG